MTTIKDMIQAMDQIEGATKTPELINEASVTVSANAESAAEVGDLMRVLALGGVVNNDGSTQDLPHMHPDAADHDEVGSASACGGAPEQGPTLQGGDIDTDMMKRQLMAMDAAEEATEDYANEPDEEHHSMSDIIASGDDIHKSKKMHKPAAGGDNPMSVEETDIKEALLAALAEKKKPDADGDGVPDWADKKPGADDNAEDEEEDVKESLWNDLVEALEGVQEGRGRGKKKTKGRGKKK